MTNTSKVFQGDQIVEKAQIQGPIPLVEITGETSDVRVKATGRKKEPTVKRDHRRGCRQKIR